MITRIPPLPEEDGLYTELPLVLVSTHHRSLPNSFPPYPSYQSPLPGPSPYSYPHPNLNSTSPLGRILPLTRPIDDMRQIPDRKTEREVQTRQHDGEEDPPSGHGRDEAEGAASLDADTNLLAYIDSFHRI